MVDYFVLGTDYILMRYKVRMDSVFIYTQFYVAIKTEKNTRAHPHVPHACLYK